MRDLALTLCHVSMFVRNGLIGQSSKVLWYFGSGYLGNPQAEDWQLQYHYCIATCKQFLETG